MYKIIFFGTSAFAVPSLKALAEDGRFEIAAVITRADKPVGRHAEVTPPAIKVSAESLGIAVQQPETLKDEAFGAWLKEIGPTCDAFVVVSYGKILPSWILELPKQGIVNVHGSLLPRWRGPSPIQSAIAEGDSMTGVTIMKINEKMDQGPILSTEETHIAPNETGGQLHDRLAKLGAQVLPFVLAGYLDGKVKPHEQDHSLATTCKILTREDGKINWAEEGYAIARKVLAYNPWPGTWTMFGDKRLKILKADVLDGDPNFKPGKAYALDGRPCVATKNGVGLELVEIQMEGKKPMAGQDFLKGQKDWENAQF